MIIIMKGYKPGFVPWNKNGNKIIPFYSSVMENDNFYYSEEIELT